MRICKKSQDLQEFTEIVRIVRICKRIRKKNYKRFKNLKELARIRKNATCKEFARICKFFLKKWQEFVNNCKNL